MPSGAVTVTNCVCAPLEPFWMRKKSVPVPGTETLICVVELPIFTDLVYSTPSNDFVLLRTSEPETIVNLPLTSSAERVPASKSLMLSL